MMGLPLHEQMHCYHRNRVISTELIKKMVGKGRIVIAVTHNIKILIFLFYKKADRRAQIFRTSLSSHDHKPKG
tara:strand:+ start:342 stop:560 length:219 start_codon:yes stop_codon:yes gene_type:complete